MPQTPQRPPSQRPSQSPRTTKRPRRRASDAQDHTQEPIIPPYSSRRDLPEEEEEGRGGNRDQQSPTRKKRPPSKHEAQQPRHIKRVVAHRSLESEKKHQSVSSTERSSNALSIDSLAKLDAFNEKATLVTKERERKSKRGRMTREKEREKYRERERDSERNRKRDREKDRERDREKDREREKRRHRRRSERLESREKEKEARGRRVVSGPLAEEGNIARRRDGGGYASSESEGRWRSRRKLWIGIGVLVLLLAILIPVGVVLSKKKGGGDRNADGGGGGGGDGGAMMDEEDPANENLKAINENDIPTSAKGSLLDPFTWYDTTDFNVTYTTATVGGLSIMGLNSTWNDSAQANEYVPPLNKPWAYGTMPIRGVNLGGWLSVEPFITPSLFNSYKPNQGVVDEYTLCAELGPSKAAKVLEKHYARFVTEQTFREIQAAGLDHIRIPFSYWAITTYPGDPYVPKISWRYLLRAIEYARKYGLRVNLDVHGLPGSQNGWNHSGRLGAIGWLNGTDGARNAQRSLDLHAQLSAFFAQPRYRNVVAIYGLVNEPKMSSLNIEDVLTWTESAVQVVRRNGIKQIIAFGDGFLGLLRWKGKFQGLDGLVLDAHQYTIFNPDEIAFSHQKKIEHVCSGWSELFEKSMDVSTGFGPTLCGEWSQADTDCAPYLNNIGGGNRWLGTLKAPNPAQSILTPLCPGSKGKNNKKCSCDQANADPSTYSDTYKRWLRMNAEAQMHSFEKGWGWFYWTWVTEDAVQWSWKGGMSAGILPQKSWIRDFKCDSPVEDFGDL